MVVGSNPAILILSFWSSHRFTVFKTITFLDGYIYIIKCGLYVLLF
ncbi:hypothetical protein BE22_0027 [Staphylococcus phage vB_SepS_BE22]|nr:hypothetical protein BE22_0027 [Staphylococcus phage vB_SepS_BE22]